MDKETFSRANGLVRTADMQILQSTVLNIKHDLVNEGFHEKDVMYFLAKTVNDVMANG